MRELRRDFDALVAQRWHRSLPMQRLRPLPQDERHEPAARQINQKTGKPKRFF